MAGLNRGIMSLKYIILNFLLMFVVLMVSIENYDTWTQRFELLPEHQETVKKSAAKVENPPAVGTNKEPTSLRSFIVISEKNIFSPERKDFPMLTVEKSNSVTRPRVILYGVTIAGDFQAASLANPGRPLKKGERETITVKIGEKIGGYKLARIQPDRITMESNGDSFEVLLYDSRNPKKRMEVKTEVKPPAVISTQPAPAPPTVPAPQATPPATAPAPPLASIEKLKEPPQQKVVPPTPAPTPQRIPSRWERSQLRRGGIPVYPPTSPPSGVPGQTTQ
jgi:type II secretory pathway component PulC